MRAEIVPLAQQHLEAPSRRVPRNARAVDAAADDEQVHFAGSGAFRSHSNAAFQRATEAPARPGN